MTTLNTPPPTPVWKSTQDPRPRHTHAAAKVFPSTVSHFECLVMLITGRISG